MNAPVKQTPALLDGLAAQFGLDRNEFWNIIKTTIMPREASNEETAAFLMVCRNYNLNPMLKEIHAFKNRKTGGIIPVISIDGYSTMVNRHPQFDGVEFAFQQDAGDGSVIACTCTMFRKDRSRPVTVTEFMAECSRDTDAWKLTPARMLRHRAFMQAARLCFGFTSFDDDGPDLQP